MSTITVSKSFPVGTDVVWEELRHIDRHVQWMHDAVRIEFTTAQESGVGTSFICDTKIGPLTTRDRMTITEWVDGSVMGVRHEGLVTGVGRFTITGDRRSSTLNWEERLTFPWWFAGPIGAALAVPILRFVWRRNLTLLAQRVA